MVPSRVRDGWADSTACRRSVEPPHEADKGSARCSIRDEARSRAWARCPQRRRWGCEHRGMFSGAHVILYSQDAEADRAFIKDVLGFAHIDAGHGWLIFKLPPAEVAVHPTDGAPRHEFYLMCDDL